MQIKVSAESLRKAASYVGKLSKEGAIAPFNHVLLRCDGRALTLTASDGMASCSATVEATRGGKLECTVSARKLAGLSGAWTGGDLSLSIDKNSLVVANENHTHTFPTGDVEAFAIRKRPSVASIDADAHLRAIRGVITSCSTDATRATLCGAYFDGPNLVASDGRRMTVAEIPDHGHKGIVPVGALQLVESVLADSDSVSASVGDGYAFNRGDRCVWGGLIDGTYPAWKAVINSVEPTVTVTVPREAMLDAVTRARLVVDAAYIGIEKGRIKLHGAMPDAGSCVEYIGSDIGATGADVMVNLSFLSDALSSVDDETARIEWGEPLKPVRIAYPGIQTIIMPMRGM